MNICTDLPQMLIQSVTTTPVNNVANYIEGGTDLRARAGTRQV